MDTPPPAPAVELDLSTAPEVTDAADALIHAMYASGVTAGRPRFYSLAAVHDPTGTHALVVGIAGMNDAAGAATRGLLDALEARLLSEEAAETPSPGSTN